MNIDHIRIALSLILLLLLSTCTTAAPIVLEAPVDCQPQNFVATHADLEWSSAEISSICSLWLGNLPDLPPDPTNHVADNPAAAQLGQRIFFDTAFSADHTIACATCHQPERNFTDGLSLPIGGGTRKTPTIVGTAYNSWFFWDGRKDSQWAQALGPLESSVEHRGSREQYAGIIANDASYRNEYEAIFGTFPDLGTANGTTEVFVNMGKAIAAYERLIMPASAPFDHYAQAVLAHDTRTMQQVLSEDAVAGLSLFINQAQCLNCHNGALFTNGEFHGTAVVGMSDIGRIEGAIKVLADEFNCRSMWSDSAENCPNLRFIRTTGIELEAAFKTPTLRNIATMPPYAHNGSFNTLADMLQHYDSGGFGASFGTVGHNELSPLNLTETELAQLEAFLQTLTGGISAEPSLLIPPP